MAASEMVRPKARVSWIAMGAIVFAAVGTSTVLSFVKGDDPKNVAVYSANGDGMDALLIGIVEVTPSCVTVSVGDEIWTPVFPRGSTYMANDTLEWGGREFLSGDPIELGGGEAKAVSDSVIPAGCPRSHLWVVAPR